MLPVSTGMDKRLNRLQPLLLALNGRLGCLGLLLAWTEPLSICSTRSCLSFASASLHFATSIASACLQVLLDPPGGLVCVGSITDLWTLDHLDLRYPWAPWDPQSAGRLEVERGYTLFTKFSKLLSYATELAGNAVHPPHRSPWASCHFLLLCHTCPHLGSGNEAVWPKLSTVDVATPTQTSETTADNSLEL